MKSIAPRYLAALVAVIAVLACGDVPTLDNGIAYISPVQLPAPVVAAGDSLRDSLGRVVPLSIVAYDRSDAPIPGVSANFIVSSFPAGVTIDGNGKVFGLDSIRSVQIVGRVGDRLQTPPVILDVVPQPDSIAASGVPDSLKALSLSRLGVSVTGVRGGQRVRVKGIIVKYTVTSVYPARSFDSSFVFLGSGRLTASDTTTTDGTSTTVGVKDVTGLDSVAVLARANNLRGQPLKGSPVRFVIPVKRGT